MKISLKWLSEYVEVPANIKEFCDRLDLTGTGVEGVETLGAQLDGVVVGQVLTCEPHPDSDHMHVVSVNVGASEPLQIVCGAPNIAANIKVPVACIGAHLPGDITIKKGKLRGVASFGMCCSQRELGFGGDHSGIWVLPADAPVGMNLADYLQQTDTVLDLEITPNRPDCLSVVGFAREVGAMYQIPYCDPLPSMAEKLHVCTAGSSNDVTAHNAQTSSEALEDVLSITVEDATRCPRYCARVIRDVKVGPSPDWLVERLEAIGQRSINNVVDVTNYILFLFGQPLHTFDLAALTNAQGKANVIIRPAYENEQLTTLDGTTRTLTPDMTVIATPERGAVALAGVMGGLDSEVTNQTTDILLETATFEAGRTSRTSRNLGLISESSLRYERGVDDHNIELRSAAAAALIVEVAGGYVLSASASAANMPREASAANMPREASMGADAVAKASTSTNASIDARAKASTTTDTSAIDVWENPSAVLTNMFRLERFQRMMGASIPLDFVRDVLTRLGCTVRATENEQVLHVTSPSFRPDLEREIDLYEEVLRLYGMDKITCTLPGGRGRYAVKTPEQKREALLIDALRASGLNETMTYSFADPHDLENLRMDAHALGLGEPVELINPMSTEQSVMRQSIVPGLLRCVAYNQNRGVKNVQLFEIGVVFSAAQGHKKPKERTRVAGVLAGAFDDKQWNSNPVSFDFFDGKGVIENICRELAIPKLRFRALEESEAPHLQPGRAAHVVSGGSVLGWVGELHPLAVEAFDAQAPVVAFELDVAALLRVARDARDYVDVPTFPAVGMDVAFVVDEDVTCERLMQCMTSAAGKTLESATLFDVYRSDLRVGRGKKSMAFKLVYRSPEKTLTSQEVEKTHAKMIKKVSAATGAQVRG